MADALCQLLSAYNAHGLAEMKRLGCSEACEQIDSIVGELRSRRGAELERVLFRQVNLLYEGFGIEGMRCATAAAHMHTALPAPVNVADSARACRRRDRQAARTPQRIAVGDVTEVMKAQNEITKARTQDSWTPDALFGARPKPGSSRAMNESQDITGRGRDLKQRVRDLTRRGEGQEARLRLVRQLKVDWGAHVLPVGTQLSARRVEELRVAGVLPRLLPYQAVSLGGGQLPWRCEAFYVPPTDAGVGCVVRVLCSVMASSADILGLRRDAALMLKGGVGGEISFATLQGALERLVHTDAPAGAIVLRIMRNGTSEAWWVLELDEGVYIWGSMLRRASGAVKTHAIGYNAEAKLLYLGFVTLALTADDLSNLGAFVESLDLDHGVFVGDAPDVRRVCVVPTHPGARALPCFPAGCLTERPRPSTKKARRR